MHASDRPQQKIYEFNPYEENVPFSHRIIGTSTLLQTIALHWFKGAVEDVAPHYVMAGVNALHEGLSIFLLTKNAKGPNGERVVLKGKAFMANMLLFSAIDMAKYYALDYVGLPAYMAQKFGLLTEKIGSHATPQLQAGLTFFGGIVRRSLHAHCTDFMVRQCNQFYKYCCGEKK